MSNSDLIDVDDDEEGPVFPLTVKVAGYVWLAIGVVLLLFSPLLLFAGGCIALFAGAVGARFFFGGWAVTDGKAKDVLWAAVQSILLGLPPVGLMIYNYGTMPLTGQLVVGIAAMPFVTAGLLAIYGRGEYLRWRRAFKASLPPPADGNGLE